MSRRRVPLERLLADLRGYHTYLEQDPCANRRAKAFVEARIGYCQAMKERKSASTDCGELAGSTTSTYCPGHNPSSASKPKDSATI